MARVLILIGDTKISGPVKGVLQLLENLQLRPGEYKLVNCVTDEMEYSEIVEGARACGVAMQQVIHSSRGYWSLFKQIRTMIQTQKVDIVQTHGYKQTFIGLLLKYFVRIKWISFLHGTTSEDTKARIYHVLDNIMQRFADRTVLVTEQQRKLVLGGTNCVRVRVVRNGIDISKTCKWVVPQSEARTELELGWAGNVVYAVVGRLSPEKGVDVFLKAFALALHENSTIRALIVGDGPERENLTKLSKELGLHNGLIKFIGYSSKPLDYMSAADFIVLPSRSEGIPNVALEAMAMSRMVVATEVGGVPEIIISGESGWLIPPDYPKGLAEAMLMVVEENELSFEIALNGRERVERFFSPEVRADNISKIYCELLGES